MKKLIGTNAIFNITEKDYFVISPIGKLSPFSYATKSKTTFFKAKSIYSTILMLTCAVAFAHYKMFNDYTSGLSWLTLFLIVISSTLLLYAIYHFTLEDVVKYSWEEHGDFVKEG